MDGQGTHVALKAEKKGDYTVTVTYPPVFGKTFKELEIKVNVKEGTPPEEPVVKVVAVDPPEKINIGDTAEISFKGYDQFDNEKPVNIKLLSVFPGNFLEASVVDNKLQVKGLFGVGIGKGLQKDEYLPAAQTDYIFPAIGEEFGLVGTLFIEDRKSVVRERV